MAADFVSWQTPVEKLWGVGPERQSQLARLGLRCAGDLLLHRPRRYEDRRRVASIASLPLNEAATLRGKIVAAGLKRWNKGSKSVFEIVVDDGTARLHCRWWNLPFMQNYFQVGDDLLVYGKLLNLKPRTMDHPETELVEPGEEASIHLNRIVPIYSLTEGLPQRWLRSLIYRTLEDLRSRIPEPVIGRPIHCREPFWPTRAEAISLLHVPNEEGAPEVARRRLAFDELVELQIAIRTRRKRLEASARALSCGGDNRLIRRFLPALGFSLTAAQTKVLREIRGDMTGPHPMRRLLQGDVGSGKTVVAAAAALMALESGFDVAVMAPTEILAEQHFKNFQRWLRPLGVSVELWTGSVKSDEGTASEKPRLYAGTHALIERAFAPRALGLVIIDEQHKFGVAQREKLLRKGVYPHLLVMTATPIPRTLGLTVYGDLDISVIDQLPEGRAAIQTFVRAEDKLPKVWEFVRGKLNAGRQAFVVYPRLSEADEKAGLKAVALEHGKLQKLLAPHRVGLLHGRLSGEDKESVMRAFASNQIQMLVATSVIEVGIDVPNATVMVIENADQFGLAQLHQLRGRVGRGAEKSFCILISSAGTPEGTERLRVLETTTDGFRIAEEDMRLRGAGELTGQQQSGLPPFIFADFRRDQNLVEMARNSVRENLK